MDHYLEQTICTPNWLIDHHGGKICSLSARFGGTLCQIPMRSDDYAGVSWLVDGKEVPLETNLQNGQYVYTGQITQADLSITLTLSYTVNQSGHLVITAGIRNRVPATTRPVRASLRLGFDTFLAQYPDFNDQLFPTLLRCEKTHLWGYFSSPSGKILTLFTDSPTASYTLDYEKDAQGIFTATVDLLHPGKLPERHPEGLDRLSGGETKIWNLTLLPVADLYDIASVKPTISAASLLPLLHADHYSPANGEESHITVFSHSPICQNTLQLKGPDGQTRELPLSQDGPSTYRTVFHAKNNPPGLYTLTARNEAGYDAKMCLSIRRPWSWYIKMARKAAIDAPQKASTHAESWYGFYSAYIARQYFPDKNLDDQLDEQFLQIFSLLYQPDTNLPLVQKDRIQNHSSMLGVLVRRYECTKERTVLEQAELLADLVLKFQRENGGFYKGNTDYTSVIYPAKSIMELLYAELSCSEDPSISPEERTLWQSRAQQHTEALCHAMDHLVGLDGQFQTEGATSSCYEDGANSCSSTQLSEFALLFPEGSPRRVAYTNAARKILEKHTSHEQALIPDSRMVGGTLRYWEAQYDVEMGPTPMAPRAQMMDSPHGWSAWNIYGLFHLYELTGEVSYLQRGMNTMGACAQLMGFDGTLRWAFVPDPYRQTQIFIKDEAAAKRGEVAGKHIQQTIGETYIPMISNWWTAPPMTQVSGYTAMGGSVTQGSACDNDVHEVFKAMGELVLTKAYIVETDSMQFICYNATCTYDEGTLTILPAEEVISEVSVQLLNPREVFVHFGDETITKSMSIGNPHWLRKSTLSSPHIIIGNGAESFG